MCAADPESRYGLSQDNQLFVHNIKYSGHPNYLRIKDNCVTSGVFQYLAIIYLDNMHVIGTISLAIKMDKNLSLQSL